MLVPSLRLSYGVLVATQWLVTGLELGVPGFDQGKYGLCSKIVFLPSPLGLRLYMTDVMLVPSLRLSYGVLVATHWLVTGLELGVQSQDLTKVNTQRPMLHNKFGAKAFWT